MSERLTTEEVRTLLKDQEDLSFGGSFRLSRVAPDLAADLLDARAEVERQAGEIADLRARKDEAYRERNLVVCALSKLFPASIEAHVGEDWGPEWQDVVFIQLPSGLVSWHIPISEMEQFHHLPYRRGMFRWDGHNTKNKYARLAALGGQDER